MEQPYCYIENFPLQKHYDVCREYLNRTVIEGIDHIELYKRGAMWLEVSDVMRFFPHLELDENYKLICYLACSLHGFWGYVAAIHRNDSQTPKLYPKDMRSAALYGTYFEPPENAIPAMEAIYNDGTPEGYLEALLCELFLYALPHANRNWEMIMTAPPSDLCSAWNSYLDIADWRPRAIFYEHRISRLLVFRRTIEDGFDLSTGQDTIHLAQYKFWKGTDCYQIYNSRESVYHGQLGDHTRYTDKRCCCVSRNSSILIAEQKSPTEKVFDT